MIFTSGARLACLDGKNNASVTVSVAPSVSSPFARQATRAGQIPRVEERAGAEPFILPARDAPKPERKRPEPKESGTGLRSEPARQDGPGRMDAADAAVRREASRDAERLAADGAQDAHDAKVSADAVQRKDATEGKNEAAPVAEAATDKGAVEDSDTISGQAADPVLQPQPDKAPVILLAADLAQKAANETVSVVEAGHRGVDAAAATLAGANPAGTVKNTSDNATSVTVADLSGETVAASGAVAGSVSASNQPTKADDKAAGTSGDALTGVPGGKAGSAAQSQPEADAGAAADAQRAGDGASSGNGIKTGLPWQPDDSGSEANAVDAARDAARLAAKTELMSQLEQGTGGTPQPQAKPGDVPQLKPDLLPPPEAPLPHGAKAIPPSAVPVEIGLRTLQGLREFQIKLDPAELGRVDVRLEINDDKTVSARVVVDRVETLHLLQRDAKTLERAFEQAGLKSSDSGIDITLRDPGQQTRQGRGEAWAGEGQVSSRRNAAIVTAEPVLIPIRRTLHVGALDRSI